jgi:periplasmic copper chaperone A
MKKLLLTTVAAGICGLLATSASAHNTLTSMEGYAGYVTDFEMRVTHGCKGSPVKEVRVKIPEGVMRVSVGANRDWKTEVKMRKLDKPVPGEGGTMITETADQIIWKDPASPIPAGGVFEGFKFRGALPKEENKIIFFQTINVCEAGDDKYVDLPKEELKAADPDFKKKLWAFMTATPGPAPFLITMKAPKPQYPWEPMEAPKAKAEAPTQQKAASN